MLHLGNEREVVDNINRNITERRSGQERRILADRRCEARFGDVMERRQNKDRRGGPDNISID